MIGNTPTSPRIFASKVLELQFYIKLFEVHSHLRKWLMEMTEHLKLVKNLIQGLLFSLVAFGSGPCSKLSWNKRHLFSMSVLLHYWLVGIWIGQTKCSDFFFFFSFPTWVERSFKWQPTIKWGLKQGTRNKKFVGFKIPKEIVILEMQAGLQG